MNPYTKMASRNRDGKSIKTATRRSRFFDFIERLAMGSTSNESGKQEARI
jgi:hypothetical protein